MVNLKGALESAEISKSSKTDANYYESEKNQTTVAVINEIDSRYELVPEAAINSGESIDRVVALSKMFKANNTKMFKCQ